MIFKNNCANRYINLGKSISTYGCDNNIVYYYSTISSGKEDYDNRIENINKVIENTNVPLYIYYIAKRY